jgi:hypothetical protein
MPRDKVAVNAYNRKYRKEHPEWAKGVQRRRLARIKADPQKFKKFQENRKKRTKKWRINNPDAARASDRNRNASLKLRTIKAYGGKCACCKELDLRFLTIDHIGGGGNKHRATLGSRPGGIALYCWLQRNNYPKGFQVLCWQCNCGRSINNGVCPHKDPKGRITVND